MPSTDLPILLEPEALAARLDAPDVRIVDLSRATTYSRFHVPGAVHLNLGDILRHQRPVVGLLPDLDRLTSVIRDLGVDQDTHIVAYDDEAGAKACRLLWTLDAAGHERYSLLNGGLHAWSIEGHPLSRDPVTVQPGNFVAHMNDDACADADYILSRLEDGNLRLLDVRSPGEFDGSDRRALRGGHIPGAISMNWTTMQDKQRNRRLLPPDVLSSELAQRTIEPGNEVVTYCQSHQRSAYSFVALKALGFRQVRGYPGAWSEWGNRPDTPVETN